MNCDFIFIILVNFSTKDDYWCWSANWHPCWSYFKYFNVQKNRCSGSKNKIKTSSLFKSYDSWIGLFNWTKICLGERTVDELLHVVTEVTAPEPGKQVLLMEEISDCECVPTDSWLSRNFYIIIYSLAKSDVEIHLLCHK